MKQYQISNIKDQRYRKKGFATFSCHEHGFTLVEILVVIAVMAIVGAYVLSNFRSFGEDENLKSAILDLQSQLRTAQTNATSNIKCNAGYGATWKVMYNSATTIVLACQEPPAVITTKKTLTLGANIQIQEVSGISCPNSTPFRISFTPLKGNITYSAPTETNYPNCSALTIKLRNNQNGNTKNLIIEKGGRIYVE